MHPDPRYWRDKRVCVTGGTGFLGWHLAQQLLPLARHVRIFGLRPRSPGLAARLAVFDCVFGDIRDAGAVHRALGGMDVVFHTAGTVSVWGRALMEMHDIHVGGTQQILNALAPHARLVHTSSVVAIGAARRGALNDGAVLTEASPFTLQHFKVDYVHAKKAAEDLALAATRDGKRGGGQEGRGQDVVVLNPAYLLGPEDFEGSIMGRFCVRCWRGRVPLIPQGGMNFVDVRDAACGHLLAAERGARGRRYILGGANLTMAEFVRTLASVRGMSSRWWLRMPHWLHTLLACGAEVRACLTGREPYPSQQHVRLSQHNWYYSWQRARSELGYEARPLIETLRDTHEWYCANGQLKRIAPAGAALPDHQTVPAECDFR